MEKSKSAYIEKAKAALKTYWETHIKSEVMKQNRIAKIKRIYGI